MRDAELRLLSALHEATRSNIIQWARVESDDRDIYRASIGEERIEIEYVYVPIAGGECADRFIACVHGLGVWFQVAIGTEAYNVISAMLSLQIYGWAEGRASALKALAHATTLVEAISLVKASKRA